MQPLRQMREEEALLIGWGVRVLLLARPGAPDTARALHRLAAMGSGADVVGDIYAAVSEVMDDPHGYGLVLADCDAFGGIEAGLRLLRHLRAAPVTVPVLLMTRDCPVQRFPEDRLAPVVLRSPPSAVSLRVAFEHALRDWRIWPAP